MSAMRLHAALRRSRRRLVVVLAVLGLAGAVAAHHDAPLDTHALPAAALCLATVAVASTPLAGAAVAFWRRSWVQLVCARERPGWGSSKRRPPARAGPLLAQLQVLRR